MDLLRVGVLLLGISAPIVAGLTTHAYYRSLLYSHPIVESFHAYCSFGTVVIHANDELRDVRVFSSDGTLMCKFNAIPRGSDEVCDVNADGVYVVQVGNLKRAATCSIRPAPYPRGLED